MTSKQFYSLSDIEQSKFKNERCNCNHIRNYHAADNVNWHWKYNVKPNDLVGTGYCRMCRYDDKVCDKFNNFDSEITNIRNKYK